MKSVLKLSPEMKSPTRRDLLINALCVSALAVMGRRVIADDAAPVPSSTTQPSGLKLGSLKADKILFVGNSITLHGAAPAIGWTGNWGMAATSIDKDYVHLLLSRLMKQLGTEPASMIRNIADFERTYSTFDLTTGMKDEVAFAPDLIIVAIGENVPALASDTDKANFEKAMSALVKSLKADRDPAVFVRSCFWADPAKDVILHKICDGAGGTFIDISALGKDGSNAAGSERKIAHAGVAGHPGDKGMAAIADAIWGAMTQRAAIAPRPA